MLETDVVVRDVEQPEAGIDILHCRERQHRVRVGVVCVVSATRPLNYHYGHCQIIVELGVVADDLPGQVDGVLPLVGMNVTAEIHGHLAAIRVEQLQDGIKALVERCAIGSDCRIAAYKRVVAVWHHKCGFG